MDKYQESELVLEATPGQAAATLIDIYEYRLLGADPELRTVTDWDRPPGPDTLSFGLRVVGLGDHKGLLFSVDGTWLPGDRTRLRLTWNRGNEVAVRAWKIGRAKLEQRGLTKREDQPGGVVQMANISGIPSSLNRRLREDLLKCGPFNSDKAIRAIFVNDRISQWQNELPESSSPIERVEAVIDFLLKKQDSSGQNGLCLLLQVLSERHPPEDVCHQRLVELAKEVEERTSRP